MHIVIKTLQFLKRQLLDGVLNDADQLFPPILVRLSEMYHAISFSSQKYEKAVNFQSPTVIVSELTSFYNNRKGILAF